MDFTIQNEQSTLATGLRKVQFCGEGATLEFEIVSDQSFLLELISELKQFIEHARSLE